MAQSSRKRRQPKVAAHPFFAQPIERIVAALTRPITQVLTHEQLKAHQLEKEWVRFKLTSAAPARRPAIPMLILAHYESEVWRPYREAVAASRRHGRAPSEDLLLRGLRTAFPDMAEDDLFTLSRSTVTKLESDSRAAVLGAYAGRPFAIGASAVRAAASQARQLERRWLPVLRWIASVRPELLADMIVLANLLECGWGSGSTPPPGFYEIAGPAALDLIRSTRGAVAH